MRSFNAFFPSVAARCLPFNERIHEDNMFHTSRVLLQRKCFEGTLTFRAYNLIPIHGKSPATLSTTYSSAIYYSLMIILCSSLYLANGVFYIDTHTWPANTHVPFLGPPFRLLRTTTRGPLWSLETSSIWTTCTLSLTEAYKRVQNVMEPIKLRLFVRKYAGI